MQQIFLFLSHYWPFLSQSWYNANVQEGVYVLWRKKTLLILLRCYTEKNDEGFRNESYEIARDFDESGDHQLAEYIMSLLSNVNTFVPQMEGHESTLFWKNWSKRRYLLLPDSIMQDLLGVVNAIAHRIGIHKFHFSGSSWYWKNRSSQTTCAHPWAGNIYGWFFNGSG